MSERLAHINTISTWESGGGLEMDIIELADGRVLGITDESVVLYESMTDLEENAPKKRPTIFLV